MSAVSNDHRLKALASLGHAAGHAERMSALTAGEARCGDPVLSGLATCAVVEALVYIGDQIGRVADEVAEAQKVGGPLSAIAAALSRTMTALTVATARRDSLVRYARRYTHSNDAAEDAVQAATLIALGHPDVTGPSAYAWLKTVVRHEAYRCGRMVGDVALEDLPEVGRSHRTSTS